MRLIVLSLLGSTLAGCVINSDKYPKPRDLSSATLVDRPRLLGIKVEPPEVAPGESANVSALVADPGNEMAFNLWVTCPADTASSFGCPPTFAALDLETATEEELAEAGIIGFEPFFSPVYDAPADALSNLPEDEKKEGIYQMVHSFSLPEEVDGMDDGQFDFNQIESGYKRLVVSEADTPNANPQITSWTIDGQVVGSDDEIIVRAGEKIELGIVLSETSIESYTYINQDGVSEERVEEPYANWYSTHGSVNEAVTLHPFLQADWVAPNEPISQGVWWVVLRDRRGGLTWSEQSYSVVQ